MRCGKHCPLPAVAALGRTLQTLSQIVVLCRTAERIGEAPLGNGQA